MSEYAKLRQTDRIPCRISAEVPNFRGLTQHKQVPIRRQPHAMRFAKLNVACSVLPRDLNDRDSQTAVPQNSPRSAT